MLTRCCWCSWGSGLTLFSTRGAKDRHLGTSPAALWLGGTLTLKTPGLVLYKSNVAFWRGQRQRQRSSKSILKGTASSEQLARKLGVCKLKLHLVLQLITWAEMELHIITSEHEVLNTLLPAHNPAPDLDTFSTFDHAAVCCPSAPLIIFLCRYHFVWMPQSLQAYPLRCSTLPQPVLSLVSFGVGRLHPSDTVHCGL